MTTKQHWDDVYATKATTEVSWFQQHPELSLALIARATLATDAAILDVGGGASTLVDGLLALGYTNVTVLDLSGTALAAARHRLGARADQVTWLEGDVRDADLPAADLWHDRAVFHFLTDPADRAAYRAQLRATLRPGGQVVIATFAEDGPTRCSGLPVQRYSPAQLAAELGAGYRLVESEREEHHTPLGSVQAFTYGRFAVRA